MPGCSESQQSGAAAGAGSSTSPHHCLCAAGPAAGLGFAGLSTGLLCSFVLAFEKRFGLRGGGRGKFTVCQATRSTQYPYLGCSGSSDAVEMSPVCSACFPFWCSEGCSALSQPCVLQCSVLWGRWPQPPKSSGWLETVERSLPLWALVGWELLNGVGAPGICGRDINCHGAAAIPRALWWDGWRRSGWASPPASRAHK